MKNYAVDASVILKWVLGNERESDHEQAMALLETWTEGDIELSAPILWQYEVGNFLGRRLKEEAMDKMNLLLNLNIRNVAFTDGMWNQCFTWMRQRPTWMPTPRRGCNRPWTRSGAAAPR